MDLVSLALKCILFNCCASLPLLEHQKKGWKSSQGFLVPQSQAPNPLYHQAPSGLVPHFSASSRAKVMTQVAFSTGPSRLTFLPAQLLHCPPVPVPAPFVTPSPHTRQLARLPSSSECQVPRELERGAAALRPGSSPATCEGKYQHLPTRTGIGLRSHRHQGYAIFKVPSDEYHLPPGS